jgi:hypothetical protein
VLLLRRAIVGRKSKLMAVHKSWKLNTSGIQWKPTSQALSKIDRRCSSLETDTNPDEREKKKEEEWFINFFFLYFDILILKIIFKK